MRLSNIISACLIAFGTLSFGGEIPADHYLWGAKSPKLAARATTTTRTPDPACTNDATHRSCWKDGFSIATDFDKSWPNTGRTRYYNLEITNTTCNPDGNGARTCMLVNNKYPAETIIADWGDTISVTVKNSLPDNGTSIHWHGLRQLNTNVMDGVNGITECPLAPGKTKTYKFLATQFGTSWYHSHYSAQYGDGVVGTIIINGPAQTNYDIDLGTYALTDWYYPTAYQIESIADANLQQGRGPPPGDNILINGTNKNANGGGSYGKVSITKGKKYRLRIVNTSVDAAIRVSLDNHLFTVTTADFVPVKSFTTQWLLLAIGQRYDVVFTANQDVGNYWFRATIAGECASANRGSGLSIFSYVGAASGEPSTTSFPVPTGCNEPGPLVPWVANTVPKDLFVSQAQNLNVDIGRTTVTTNHENIVYWGVNMTGIDIDWRDPTIQYIKEGNTSYPRTYNLVEIPNEATWTYWIIQETEGTVVPIPHPMHLHGHDFYILGKGTGVFNKDTDIDTLQFDNPMRRDVTFLPGGGWVVLAFPSDNPGAWLMHCHIAWHVSAGLGVQFLERKSEIFTGDSAWDQVCTDWADYYNGNPAWLKQDSGL